MNGKVALRKLHVFVAGGALLALAAGVSYAAIPSSNGVISACTNPEGQVRLIDKEAGQTCSGLQTLVEWNQQGPAGPAGATGPSGPAGPIGPAGPAGPSDLYYKSDVTTVVPAGAFATLVARTLPAGKYLLFAKATVGTSSAVSSGTCYLQIPGGTADLQAVNVNVTSTDRVWLMGPAELSTSSVARLDCGVGTAGGLTVVAPSIGAIKVGNLNT